MLEIVDVIKTKYNINNLNHLRITNNIQLLEFNLNAFANIKIYKINNEYNLIISIINSNTYPTKNINVNLKYNTLERLIIDLECFYFS